MNKKKSETRFVLIDDDELIHLAWSRAANKNNVDLACYKSVIEFLAQKTNFSSEVKIFIDSHLSDELRGEVEAEKIFNEGFENIFLATGYAKNDLNLDGFHWIKDIVSKRPPFKEK